MSLGRHLLLTTRPGAAPSIRSTLPLRTPTGPTAGKNTAGGRSGAPQQAFQTRPFTAVTATGLISPLST